MSEIITVGLYLAKNVFQVHGADEAGRPVLRKKLPRGQVLAFFRGLQPCVVAMEACGGAHFWGREVGKLGHDVRLIPPVYVKPFVKRQKNDAADAEAICEAALRPTMRFVPVKSEETQGAAMVFRVRELLIRQRTQAINALRRHLSEFGQVVPQGPGFCGLARSRASATLDRWQTATGGHDHAGRTIPSPPADHRRQQRHHQTSHPS